MQPPVEALVEARGRGKVILLGEHAVVYGAPALVLGIERYVTARLWPVPTGGSAVAESSTLELLGQTVSADSAGDPTARAWSALLRADGRPEPCRVVLAGDLPAGVGLGYSAAAGIALGRAVERLLVTRGTARAAGSEDDRVLARAMAWERVFHGNPSGVDPAAALHGGVLRFSTSSGVLRLASSHPIELCVGLSGIRSSTREMVDSVAQLRERDPRLVDSVVDEITALVGQAERCLADGAAIALGRLLDATQQLLGQLGTSCESTDELCRTARSAGAYGAKLTGAGGGGSVIALVGLGGADAAHRASRVLASWEARGFEGFLVRAVPDPVGANEDDE